MQLELGQIIDWKTRDHFNGLQAEIDRLKEKLATWRERAEKIAHIKADDKVAFDWAVLEEIDRLKEIINEHDVDLPRGVEWPSFAELALMFHEMQERAERAEAKYDELLMAVQRKFPGETRHETALKYIRDAETIKDCMPKQAMRGNDAEKTNL